MGVYALCSLPVLVFGGCTRANDLRKVAPYAAAEERIKPESARERFTALLIQVEADAQEVFLSSDKYPATETDKAFKLFSLSSTFSYYALACLANAARYLDETNWMGVFSDALIKKALEIMQEGHVLDEVFSKRESSADEDWDDFVRLVAALEWNPHPRALRDDLVALFVCRDFEKENLFDEKSRAIVGMLRPRPQMIQGNDYDMIQDMIRKITQCPSRNSESGSMRFGDLMGMYGPFIVEAFSSAEEDVRIAVQDIISHLNEDSGLQHHASFYSLACLLNAAFFVDEGIRWKTDFAIHLVRRATACASAPYHPFDSRFISTDSELFDSPEGGFDLLVFTVPVLEWSKYPKALRAQVGAVYINLAHAANILANRSPANTFFEIVKSLAPDPERRLDLETLTDSLGKVQARVIAL